MTKINLSRLTIAKSHITDGPWESDDTSKYYQGHVIRKNGMVVCRMLDLYSPALGDRHANARLIAAAPELLDVARETLTAWHANTKNMMRAEPSYVTSARDLIALIEG